MPKLKSSQIKIIGLKTNDANYLVNVAENKYLHQHYINNVNKNKSNVIC